MKKLYFAISFSNPSVVPSTLKWINPDSQVYFKGIEDPGLSLKKVSLGNIFSDFEKDGLFIQSGFAQKKKQKKLGKDIFFTMVKFEFGEKREEPVKEEMLKKSFLDIFEKAFWNVRVFCHEQDITIACSHREPRFEGNNRLKPVRVWDKDSKGNKIGSESKIIEPDGVLSFEDGAIVLKEYRLV